MKCTNLIEFVLTCIDEMQAGGYVRGHNETFAADMERVKSIAAQLERWNLRQCNEGLTEQQERLYERCKERLAELMGKYGLKPMVQGDPRGAAVAVLCPETKRYNSMGGQESGFRLHFEGK